MYYKSIKIVHHNQYLRTICVYITMQDFIETIIIKCLTVKRFMITLVFTHST